MSLRKRPKETSLKAKTARAPFGSNPTAVLPIQQFNDSYNYNMNHVDQADQLRCYYINQRKIQKGWRALFQFIFNVVLVNSFLLSHHTPGKTQYTDQFQFRTALIDALINKSTPTIQQQMGRKRSRPVDVIPTNKTHIRVRMLRLGDCAQCKKKLGLKELL